MSHEVRAKTARAGALLACVLSCSFVARAQVQESAVPASAAPAAAEQGEPSAETQAQYRDLVERGVGEFDAGRFAEAHALFLRAHQLWPGARTYRALGMAAFELRNYVAALRALTAALLDTRRPLSDQQRAEVEALIERARVFVGSYRLQLAPNTAQLRVDGNPVDRELDGSLLLEVGNHELIAQADGYTPLRRTLFVGGREQLPLVLELSPLPVVVEPVPASAAAAPSTNARTAAARRPAAHAPLWPWTLGGTGLSGGAALAVFLVTDAKAKDCPCTESEASSIESGDWIARILAGVSGGLLITSVVLLVVQNDDGPDEAPRAAVGIGPGYLFAGGRF